jgi:hypothetical protein
MAILQEKERLFRNTKVSEKNQGIDIDHKLSFPSKTNMRINEMEYKTKIFCKVHFFTMKLHSMLK